MITHIEIEGFKSFERVSLDLGHLNIFVGTNASGKSNFFDALRVLQGIGYGFSIDEIFNGKPRSATSEVWEGIRGGSSNAGFLRRIALATSARDFVGLKVQLQVPSLADPFTYSISIASPAGIVRRESLLLGDAAIFEAAREGNSPNIPTTFSRKGQPSKVRFEKSRPVLRQLIEYPGVSDQHKGLLNTCSQLLSNVQFLNPSPSVLRYYSPAPAVARMGERGEGFAALVKSIIADDSAGDAYTAWLKQLTPAEVDKVVILPGALDDSVFAIKRKGRTFPAPVPSDGTLRFAALAAAFFQRDIPETLMIEEIENGIHPTRLGLLVELLKSQSASGRPQVMATSHSPLVLEWLRQDDYRTTFSCQRDERTGASTIRPLTSIPRFKELAKEQHVSDLFAEGWLENAL